MPFNIGPGEIILILAIALLVLGPGRLPEVGSALGRTIREFRKAATDVQEAADLEPRPASGPAGSRTPAASAPAMTATQAEPDPSRDPEPARQERGSADTARDA